MEIVSSENAEHYTWGGICDGWHLLKSADLSVIQERVPPGGAEVRHYHEHAHQFFFVISGEATLELGHKKLVLRSQQGISIPPKVTHKLINASNEELAFIVVSAPTSQGDRVLVD